MNIKHRFARQAVRRAAKAFLILALLVSGAFKLLGDQDMADAFLRAGLTTDTLRTTGYVQIGLSVVLISGFADRLVAVALAILLAVMLAIIVPVMTAAVMPLGLVFIACAIVFFVRGECDGARESTA